MIDHLGDSHFLVDYLKGRPAAVELLAPLITAGRLATSIIVYAEIVEGLQSTPASSPMLEAFANLLAGVPILGLDTETGQIFARHRALLRSQGQLIPDHDLWIAATALRHRLTLMSNDRHFQRIPGLRLHPTT